MKNRNIGKIFCCLIPIIIGTYLSVKDYIELQNHPEWSVSPTVVWIKIGIGLAISAILFFVVFKRKK
ncbi:MAG: hypothetical protein PT957_00890 [Firmicutes bacterium]|nr:hypothetical protein [Bacillota bacterium]